METKKEVWKDVEGYEGLYQISSLGNVKSLDRIVYHSKHGALKLKSALLKPSFGGNGYPSVNFWRYKKYKTMLVHRLVAIHFIPNNDRKPHVNHINGNKRDFSILNLEWCTHKENIVHASKAGLLKPCMLGKTGYNHHNGIRIYQLNKSGNIIYDYGSLTDASKSVGICRKKISAHCKSGIELGGFLWKHQ